MCANDLKFSVYECDMAPLAWHFEVNPNSCGNPAHYSDYLKFSAWPDLISGRGTTHVLCEMQDGKRVKILAYVTLKASSFLSQNDEGKTLGFPALEISELAVASGHERQGLGSLMVKHAILCVYELRQTQLGIQYLVLRADPEAVGFYKKCEPKFGEISANFDEVPCEEWNTDCVPMYIKLS